MYSREEVIKILGLFFIALLLFVVLNYVNKRTACQPAILHIKSLPVCKTHGIDKSECEIPVKYCGSDEYFVEVKFKKQGEEVKERINKNVVNYIEFKEEE